MLSASGTKQDFPRDERDWHDAQDLQDQNHQIYLNPDLSSRSISHLGAKREGLCSSSPEHPLQFTEGYFPPKRPAVWASRTMIQCVELLQQRQYLLPSQLPASLNGDPAGQRLQQVLEQGFWAGGTHSFAASPNEFQKEF